MMFQGYGLWVVSTQIKYRRYEPITGHLTNWQRTDNVNGGNLGKGSLTKGILYKGAGAGFLPLPRRW